MNYRVLPFENVVKNLRTGKYRGKPSSLDSANTGYQLFDERKFAAQLGVSVEFLREIGLVIIKDFSGWNLPAEPDYKDLETAREKIEFEKERRLTEWQEWKNTYHSKS